MLIASLYQLARTEYIVLFLMLNLVLLGVDRERGDLIGVIQNNYCGLGGMCLITFKGQLLASGLFVL